MDAATRARIFEPFFTTKPEGAGFGLGLSTVREVINMHGGDVEVQSAPGKGTSFFIYLPASMGQPQPVRITSGHRDLRPQSGTSARILLVDDEEVVRRSTARLLRQAGHEVLEAPGGKEATQIYANAERYPDLVILDLDMPFLNGEQTQRVILSIDPTARILFMSGHEDFVRENSTSVGKAAGYLRKPCSVALLLSTVSDVLRADRLDEYDEQKKSAPGLGSGSTARACPAKLLGTGMLTRARASRSGTSEPRRESALKAPSARRSASRRSDRGHPKSRTLRPSTRRCRIRGSPASSSWGSRSTRHYPRRRSRRRWRVCHCCR